MSKILKIVSVNDNGGAKHRMYFTVPPDATEANVDAARHAMKHNRLLTFPNWRIAYILPA